jgi:hypothetical protein
MFDILFYQTQIDYSDNLEDLSLVDFNVELILNFIILGNFLNFNSDPIFKLDQDSIKQSHLDGCLKGVSIL